MVSIFYALKSTSCCQEKPAEQVYLVMCPETPTLLSCLIKRAYNYLVNPEHSVSKERDLFTCKHLFLTPFFPPLERDLISAIFFFRRLHCDFTMKLCEGNQDLYCYNRYLCEDRTKLPSHKQDLQAANSGWEGWCTQLCCGLSVFEEGL